ncbi:MAG: hypothetical protein M1375_00280 [Candidatus Thermoplasmatota archaeon]|nr:hypothetical protein [Candidatus Thermoplasmatota archaeon]
MNEQNGQTGDRTSKEDIRELRRQLEDRMVALGFTPEEREILFTMQPWKATWLINRLTVYDNRRDRVIKHLAEVVLVKEDSTSSLPLDTRMEIANREWPTLRTAFIRLFAADEAPAQRAQMPLASRAAFVTEQRRKVLWPK